MLDGIKQEDLLGMCVKKYLCYHNTVKQTNKKSCLNKFGLLFGLSNHAHGRAKGLNHEVHVQHSQLIAAFENISKTVTHLYSISP